MARTLCAASWMLIAVGLCSCAQETAAPVATPAPADSTPAAAPNQVGGPEQPLPDDIDRPMADRQQIPTPQPQPDSNPQPAASPPAASGSGSGNPVIDFFRAVDRGVKSTTPNDADKPLDE